MQINLQTDYMRLFGVLAFLLLIGKPVHAESKVCLPYEPETVVLTGTVHRAQFYGPPGYGETPKIDAKEGYYLLQLDQPICVLAGNDENDEEGPFIRSLQIIFNHIPYDHSLPGKKVRIRGTLSHANTGHHHTKVMISADGIERS